MAEEVKSDWDKSEEEWKTIMHKEGKAEERARCWMFVVHTDAENRKEHLYKLDWENTLREMWVTTYWVVGKELGGKLGHAHLQGFVKFKTQKRWKTLKNQLKEIFGKECDFRKVAKTPNKAAAYCRKDNDFIEEGDAPKGAGKRMDMALLKEECARPGMTYKKYLREGTYPHYNPAIIQNMIMAYTPRKRMERKIEWIWGEPRTGKTYFAAESARDMAKTKDMDWGHLDFSNGFFNGYMGEEIVVIDDIKADSIPPKTLLRMLDQEPFTASIKGGQVFWWAKYIFITSIFNPKRFWAKLRAKFPEEGDADQILGRIRYHHWDYPRRPETEERYTIMSPNGIQTFGPVEDDEVMEVFNRIRLSSGLQAQPDNQQHSEDAH